MAAERECPRCGKVERPGFGYCQHCGLPLDLWDWAERLQRERDGLRAGIMIANRALDEVAQGKLDIWHVGQECKRPEFQGFWAQRNDLSPRFGPCESVTAAIEAMLAEKQET